MSLSNLQNLSTLALDGLTTIQVDTLYIGGTDVNSLYVPYTGATKNVNLSNQNLDTTGVISTSTLNATTGNITNMVNNNLTLMNGNSSTTNTKNQILFGYNNTVTYRHAIKTKHNASADDSGNAFEFYLWKVSDGSGNIGSNKVLTISSAGVDAGTNKVTSSYVPTANADLINLLYLTNNNYTKTQTDTLLNAKANLSGANFTGVVDMGANKISSSYIPAANADLINLLYLTTNNYTKTQTDNLLNTKANLSGANFTGVVDMGANKISSSYVPAANADLINLLYLTNNYYTKTSTDTLLNAKASTSYVDTQLALKASLAGATFSGAVDMGANKISSSYVPAANADLINLLYLTNNYYTKTSADTLLSAKASLSGAVFTGAVSMGANKITATYTPSATSDLTTKTYVDTQDALKVSKAGDTMSGNLEILTSSIPYLLVSYSGYAYLPTVDTDVGLLRFHHNRDQNNKFCDVKATVRVGQYMPSIVFATNPVYSASNVNRMIICENGNIGINTMTPTTLFYVNGTTTLNGNTTVGGILDAGANKITSSFTATANTDITNKLFVDTAITTSKTNLLSGINTWTAGQIFNVGLTSNGNLDVGSNRAICNRVPTFNDDLTNKLYIDNSFVTFATYYYTKTQMDTSLALKVNKAGDTMSGNLEILNASTPKFSLSYSGYVYIPTNDTDLSIIRFENDKVNGEKYADIKTIVRGGGVYYTPSIVFATKNAWNNPITNRMIITENGNVGINTMTPSAFLDVNGTVNIKNGNQASNFTKNLMTLEYQTGGYKHCIKSRHNGSANDANNAIDFYVWQTSDTSSGIGSKQMLSITSAGVGVNTTTPTTTLEVNGTCKVSGDTTLNSAVYMTNIPQGAALNKNFLTITPSGKLEYLNYGWGFSSIFDLNVGSTTNWGAGTLKTNAFGTNRTGSSQQVLFSGHVSGYSQVAGQVVTIKLRTNPNGSTTYTYEDIKFYVNASYTHIVFPINLVRTYAYGSYDVYIYVSSSNFLTDIGDLCYLNATVLF